MIQERTSQIQRMRTAACDRIIDTSSSFGIDGVEN